METGLFIHLSWNTLIQKLTSPIYPPHCIKRKKLCQDTGVMLSPDFADANVHSTAFLQYLPRRVQRKQYNRTSSFQEIRSKKKPQIHKLLLPFSAKFLQIAKKKIVYKFLSFRTTLQETNTTNERQEVAQSSTISLL